MKFKKITVAYWHSHNLCEYKHNETFDYSEEKFFEIQKNILSEGLNVMIQQTGMKEGYVVIWINNRKFGQC